ncbi:F-box protein CPR1-like [Humulus lupulus]|uniref:F-box protein CPR1-like n=1 Tax=Humulus lupulus TaxID=3486 RepID=UPI002B40CE5B|nr:F-box protein CPR1-like [Humulus lupulus]
MKKTKKQKKMLSLNKHFRSRECESLPYEMVYEIFLNFPVKSLMRFKSVSKQWNLNISSPEFVQKHLERQILRTPQMNIFRCHSRTISEDLYYIHRNLKPTTGENFELLTKTSNMYQRKVGSNNGIVCLYQDGPDSNSRKLILWNPSMQQSRDIDIWSDKREKIHPIKHGIYCFGFGYDSRTKDYKVVNFVYIEYKNNNTDPLCLILLYSLREEKWNHTISIEPPLLPNKLIKISWRSQKAGSRVHWIAFFKDNNGDMFRSLLFFDIEEKLFGQIALPESIAVVADDSDENWHHVELASFVDHRKGSLILFEHKKVNNNNNNNGDGLRFCCDAWVVKKCDSLDYSWAKLELSISLDRRFKALGFLSESIVFVITGDEQILFNIRTQQRHLLQIGGGDILIRSHVGTCMENMLTLNK